MNNKTSSSPSRENNNWLEKQENTHARWRKTREKRERENGEEEEDEGSFIDTISIDGDPDTSPLY